MSKNIMKQDHIAKTENIEQLKIGFGKFYKTDAYQDFTTMGEILSQAIQNSLEQIK